MLRRIKYTHISVAVSCVLALYLSAGSTQGINAFYMLIWMIGSNFAYSRLKCVRCGKRLITMPPFWIRTFGLHTCAHCGKKQPP
jgi:hypothetical protein